ncbi:MAG: metal ABC transporter substrate-binding protein [Actinomycetota bacterium]|nr:metal ABC transporter substrate-binding protein [Actinomycetota bacterium]
MPLSVALQSRHEHRRRQALWWKLGAAMAILATVLPVLATACGVAADNNAPTISVVVTMWPLAQMASLIGGTKVTVTDLATPGSDPRHIPATPAVTGELAGAAVIVDVGGGYQPGLEGAIATSGHARVVSLAELLGGSDPAIWLNPQTMRRALPFVTDAMASANPAAASTYRNGARDFDQTLNSLNIDYTTTLEDCARRTFVTTDNAFGSMATTYGVVNKALPAITTPGGATAVTNAVSLLRASSNSPVFDETITDNTVLDQAAAIVGIKVKPIDTLIGPPPGGWPTGASYFSLMESDLTTLGHGLQCSQTAGRS